MRLALGSEQLVKEQSAIAQALSNISSSQAPRASEIQSSQSSISHRGGTEEEVHFLERELAKARSSQATFVRREAVDELVRAREEALNRRHAQHLTLMRKMFEA
jgi:hypothetical protein